MSATGALPQDQAFEQKRGAVRLEMRLPVEITHPFVRAGHTANLSVTGVLLDFEVPCSPGVALSFTLALPDGQSLALTGVVVRQTEGLFANQGQTGVELSARQGAQAQMLRDLIAQEQRRILRARRGLL